jgi:hypothetical protein
MRIKIKSMGAVAMAEYDGRYTQITINMPFIKKLYPKCAKRVAFCAFTHELVHYLYDKFSPNYNNVYRNFQEELVAYRVQRFFEYVTMGKTQYSGDISFYAEQSTRYFISDVKKYHKVK